MENLSKLETDEFTVLATDDGVFVTRRTEAKPKVPRVIIETLRQSITDEGAFACNVPEPGKQIAMLKRRLAAISHQCGEALEYLGVAKEHPNEK